MSMAPGPLSGPAPRRPPLAGLGVLAAGGALAAAAVLTFALAGGRAPGPADTNPAATNPAATNPGGGAAGAASAPAPIVAPSAQIVGARSDSRVPWQQALVVAVTDGTLSTVTGTDDRGAALTGAVTPTGTWSSTTALVPGATYTLSAVVLDAAGVTRTLPLGARASDPERIRTAALSPGDDRVVGVGQPVVVRLDGEVLGAQARAAIESRLRVTATPPVTGAWRWINSRELHYRAAQFWAPGTTLRVIADLDRLALPGGTWGSGVRTSTFSVGDALTSIVDVTARTMTVRRNGQVLRTMKASMGRPAYPTRNGTFVVLEKFENKVMDSATVDLPVGEDAYRTEVEHAVRLTNSGTFTHAAPWSVPDQGLRNVSHGCINLSPADAQWYFEQTRRGDVVTVVGSTAGPVPTDPGSADWNMSYADWASSA